MRVDLGVIGSDSIEIERFCMIAGKLGFSGLSTTIQQDTPVKILGQIEVYRRVDIRGKTTPSVRKQIDKVRKRAVIVSIEIGPIDSTNWAVEDNRIDLLTVNPRGEYTLRATTARMAASSDIALEIQIAPLLQATGLNRSKILKTYRETIAVASQNDMRILLTSGATTPIGLRSPVAITYVGILLGMEKQVSNNAITKFPAEIVQRNLKKLEPDYVNPSVKVLQRRKKL
ncbi:hypothetical protein EU527_15940 [Candidatus Thorarchaeota archaeon]|nr:MAG: hypothetical protein EU527_15940 [Candidatus Thorarchaeota archaeon]